MEDIVLDKLSFKNSTKCPGTNFKTYIASLSIGRSMADVSCDWPIHSLSQLRRSTKLSNLKKLPCLTSLATLLSFGTLLDRGPLVPYYSLSHQLKCIELSRTLKLLSLCTHIQFHWTSLGQSRLIFAPRLWLCIRFDCFRGQGLEFFLTEIIPLMQNNC